MAAVTAFSFSEYLTFLEGVRTVSIRQAGHYGRMGKVRPHSGWWMGRNDGCKGSGYSRDFEACIWAFCHKKVLKQN